MTLEQYLWRHHDDEMVDLVMAVLTNRHRPLVLLKWWALMAKHRRPLQAMRDGTIDSAALVDMAQNANRAARATWPRGVRMAADAVRLAANEARERGAA